MASDDPLPVTHTAEGGPPTEAPAPQALLVIDGPDLGKRLVLSSGTFRIGKGPDAALQLSDPLVSREHVLVHVSGRGVHVRDLGSKNGSFLAGARLDQGTLTSGAVLRLGSTSLKLVTSVEEQPRALSTVDHIGPLWGWSLPMRELFALIERIAPTDATVLIEGETGCGKDLCAQAIHSLSTRAKKPFVVCDVAATARTMIESELFGHVRGAFTGANTARIGAFQEASSGTLFIDELGELDLELQPRLLRAIEQRKIKPVGADQYRDVDLRVVAATNRNLEEEVRAGRFREDLYFRVAVVRLRLPPLRERKEDIPHLVRLFIGERRVELPPETLAVLGEYDWPGNVRELRNAVERGLSRLPPEGGKLSPQHLGIDALGASPEMPWPTQGDKRSLLEIRDQLIAAWERSYLEQLLARCDGNVSRAAREGGIERVYLHRLLKRHNLGGRSRDPG